jgi:hypothetical protein
MQKDIRSAGLALGFTWKVFYLTSIADEVDGSRSRHLGAKV